MKNFTLETGGFKAQVEPTDNNGTMQYVVTVLESDAYPFPSDGFTVIEQDSVLGWRQSPESIARGPLLPALLVTAITEAIRRGDK